MSAADYTGGGHIMHCQLGEILLQPEGVSPIRRRGAAAEAPELFEALRGAAGSASFTMVSSAVVLMIGYTTQEHHHHSGCTAAYVTHTGSH